MATSSSTTPEVTPSSLRPSLICSSCGSSELLRDSCAAEDVVVCKNCGSVVEAGSLEYQNEYMLSLSATKSSSQPTSLNTVKKRNRYPLVSTPTEIQRKMHIINEIERICDGLKVKEHERKMCIERANDIMHELKKASHVAIAAGLVYMMATDQSLLSLRKINDIVQLKEKNLRTVVNRIKSLPSFHGTVLPPRLPTIQEVIVDYIDQLNTSIELDEKKECITMICNIYELLLQTELFGELEQSIRSRQTKLLEPIIYMAVEYMHRTKTHSSLYEVVEEKTKAHSYVFMRRCTLIRKHLFQLAKKIPALELPIAEHKLTQITVTKFLPTLIQSKGLLSAGKIVREHQQETEGTIMNELTTDDNPYLCVPKEFNWEDDEIGNFDDIDDSELDQYFATEEEIENKKVTLEEFM